METKPITNDSRSAGIQPSHKERLFPSSARNQGIGLRNRQSIISESPPSNSVGFLFGSTPPDNHGGAMASSNHATNTLYPHLRNPSIKMTTNGPLIVLISFTSPLNIFKSSNQSQNGFRWCSRRISGCGVPRICLRSRSFPACGRPCSSAIQLQDTRDNLGE